jgi:hypothetical protein
MVDPLPFQVKNKTIEGRRSATPGVSRLCTYGGVQTPFCPGLGECVMLATAQANSPR